MATLQKMKLRFSNEKLKRKTKKSNNNLKRSKMKNEAINGFIIEAVLIDPIDDIIFKLKNKEFRDGDIRWLNDKLYKYTAFAAKTLRIEFPGIEFISNDGVLNDYTTARFIEAFTTPLNYFKSL